MEKLPSSTSTGWTAHQRYIMRCHHVIRFPFNSKLCTLFPPLFAFAPLVAASAPQVPVIPSVFPTFLLLPSSIFMTYLSNGTGVITSTLALALVELCCVATKICQSMASMDKPRDVDSVTPAIYIENISYQNLPSKSWTWCQSANKRSQDKTHVFNALILVVTATASQSVTFEMMLWKCWLLAIWVISKRGAI